MTVSAIGAVGSAQAISQSVATSSTARRSSRAASISDVDAQSSSVTPPTSGKVGGKVDIKA